MAVFTMTSTSSSSPATNTTSSTHCMDRLDAAQALLGVSPLNKPPATNAMMNSGTTVSSGTSLPVTNSSVFGNYSQSCSRSEASALDALASLASNALNLPNNQFGRHSSIVSSSSSSSSSTSSSDDDTAMPPPPPRYLLQNSNRRTLGRLRSASNPEGMEKWEHSYTSSSRLHLVLPTSILEEELSNAREACQNHQQQEEAAAANNNNHNHHMITPSHSPQDNTVIHTTSYYQPPPSQPESKSTLGTSPTTVVFSSLVPSNNNSNNTSLKKNKGNETKLTNKNSPPEEDPSLPPEELLRRARSRLLEDLSTEAGLQKGVMPLPHSLAKYSDIYNKNGRIGIYTPSERSAIIARFNQKRSRRVWNKKIRYNCRKSLADRRMRVKGRFVKRSVEQQEASNNNKTNTPSLSTVQEEEVVDTDMPDINDPEANFQPTDDQPFRRPRRHTIT